MALLVYINKILLADNNYVDKLESLILLLPNLLALQMSNQTLESTYIFFGIEVVLLHGTSISQLKYTTKYLMTRSLRCFSC